MGVIIKLNAMKNQLTSIEKKIAEYIPVSYTHLIKI